jgi:hypothetical protein
MAVLVSQLFDCLIISILIRLNINFNIFLNLHAPVNAHPNQAIMHLSRYNSVAYSSIISNSRAKELLLY